MGRRLISYVAVSGRPRAALRQDISQHMAEAATGGRPKAALGQDRKYYVSEAAVGGRPKAAFILHKFISTCVIVRVSQEFEI